MIYLFLLLRSPPPLVPLLNARQSLGLAPLHVCVMNESRRRDRTKQKRTISINLTGARRGASHHGAMRQNCGAPPSGYLECVNPCSPHLHLTSFRRTKLAGLNGQEPLRNQQQPERPQVGAACANLDDDLHASNISSHKSLEAANLVANNY